jgi:hypothetical protein
LQKRNEEKIFRFFFYLYVVSKTGSKKQGSLISGIYKQVNHFNQTAVCQIGMSALEWDIFFVRNKE